MTPFTRPGLVATLIVALLLGGCASVGPSSVSRDRFDYNGEVARSWKEQTLLNIVKTRYLDIPVFLEVAQIVSGYTLESAVSLGATDYSSGAASDILSLGAQGKWTDRPTITYTPLTGAQFNRNMLTPIPPAAVLFMMQAGWPVDVIFRIVVSSINGIDSGGAEAVRYEQLLKRMRALQKAQVLGMRVQADRPEQQVVVLFFRQRALTGEQEAMLKEVRDMLGLAPDRREFSVAFGAVPAHDGEIALLTRSMIQIFVDLGAYVEVPEADLSEGRAPPGPAPAAAGAGQLRVKYSRERPANALVMVKHRDGWFWIDDRDLESKRIFAVVMLFSTLSESGARESLPLVTIPAG